MVKLSVCDKLIWEYFGDRDRDRPIGQGIEQLNEVFAATPNLIGIE
ncbi:MAG: hypothetical protein IGR93_17455 [Hydrococcus sp. C42_A2020_068]|nr:hypothetical protein [Hydrococcus sp. C42_A2020_068]